MFEKVNLNQVFQYLLISLAFLAPLTVFGANLIICVISLLWLLSGDYESKFKQIFDSKLMIASVVFFSLHVIGLFWTSNIASIVCFGVLSLILLPFYNKIKL